MNDRDKSDLKYVIFMCLALSGLIIALGYDASWLHNCGTTKCFIGFSYNSEFKLW